jgi:UDP-N-acetylmuramoyl-tripeptide--D-alanyl-D-alanine ligase
MNGAPIKINSYGVYNVLNAAAAFAVGDLCGVEYEEVRAALAAAEPLAGRARVHRGRGIVVVDDSYNANPSSMRASLEALEKWPAGRKIAVLGDMAELGSYAQSAHHDLGRFIAGGDVDMVFWLGKYGSDVEKGIAESRKAFRAFVDMDELIDAVRSTVERGDAVLVKASRAANLDRVVDALEDTVLHEDEG